MADESNDLTPASLVRWGTLAALIVFAIVLYFRDGRRVQPLSAEPEAADSVPAAPTPR